MALTETYTLDDLRKVKGIGKKTIERIKEQFDDSEYISKYDSAIHIEPNELVNGDMLEVMDGIPDGSTDMILTDLPYGTTACKWDTVIDLESMWKQYNRVIKPSGAIVLTSSQPFTSTLVMSNTENFKYSIIWEKAHISNPFMAKKQILKRHEDVCVFYNTQCTYNPQMEVRLEKNKRNNDRNLLYEKDGVYAKAKRISGEGNKEHNYPSSIIKFNRQTGFHPTQKPVDLLEYLIKTYTDENEVVLDSTMGSGSTGVAAKNTNRKFIGIELDKDYFEIAQKRIKGVD